MANEYKKKEARNKRMNPSTQLYYKLQVQYVVNCYNEIGRHILYPARERQIRVSDKRMQGRQMSTEANITV